MQEAVQAKIMKLLDNEIIYRISDRNGLAQCMWSLRSPALLW